MVVSGVYFCYFIAVVPWILQDDSAARGRYFSKVWCSSGESIAATNNMLLERLQLDYLDMHLIHMPRQKWLCPSLMWEIPFQGRELNGDMLRDDGIHRQPRLNELHEVFSSIDQMTQSDAVNVYLGITRVPKWSHCLGQVTEVLMSNCRKNAFQNHERLKQ